MQLPQLRPRYPVDVCKTISVLMVSVKLSHQESLLFNDDNW